LGQIAGFGPEKTIAFFFGTFFGHHALSPRITTIVFRLVIPVNEPYLIASENHPFEPS
jgi:hypothetical protein